MKISQALIDIFQKQLPPIAVEYCIALWEKIPFSLIVTRTRKTKLGDFRYIKDRPYQTITLNGDLNTYQFLLTFIHEVAHLHTFTKFGINIRPHGQAWKSTFQEILAPLLSPEFFPRDILIPLRKHMLNPKASSTRDLFLMKEISKYDVVNPDSKLIFLSDLKPGMRFLLLGRVFEKGETKRTRVLCEEVDSGRKFLIAQLAKVKPE